MFSLLSCGMSARVCYAMFVYVVWTSQPPPRRLRDDDAPTVHQLQVEVSGAHAVAGHDIQVSQHLHGRPVRLHHRHAHHAPPGLLPGWCVLLHYCVESLRN